MLAVVPSAASRSRPPLCMHVLCRGCSWLENDYAPASISCNRLSFLAAFL